MRITSVALALSLLATACAANPSLSPETAARLVAARDASDIAEAICAAPEDAGRIVIIASTVGAVPIEAVVASVATGCADIVPTTLRSAAAADPARAPDFLFAYLKTAPSDQDLRRIVEALSDGLDAAGRDDRIAILELIALIYRTDDLAGAREAAAQFTALDRVERDIVAAARQIADNSTMPGLRSRSFFELNDNLPINTFRAGDRGAASRAGGSTNEGEAPSPN